MVPHILLGRHTRYFNETKFCKFQLYAHDHNMLRICMSTVKHIINTTSTWLQYAEDEEIAKHGLMMTTMVVGVMMMNRFVSTGNDNEHGKPMFIKLRYCPYIMQLH